MMQIKHLIEPKTLFLCWKALQQTGKNYIVGEVELLENHTYLLRYHHKTKDFQEAQQNGFVGLPAFQPEKQPSNGYNQGVKESLLRRLPPRSRSDFFQYLEQQRLTEHSAQISDFALLGYTEGRLPGDEFFLIHSFNNGCGPLEFIMEVVGVKHQLPNLSVSTLNLSSPLRFVQETENKYDPMAIVVYSENSRIGYVNRCQTALFHRWIHSNCQIKGSIQRLNGTQDQPRIFGFVEISPPSFI
jgi:hypothetical protein